MSIVSVVSIVLLNGCGNSTMVLLCVPRSPSLACISETLTPASLELSLHISPAFIMKESRVDMMMIIVVVVV